MFNNEDFNKNTKPLFETDFKSTNLFNQTSLQNNGMNDDIPPTLGPIGNLSGIQKIEGPTGDVLSPMNVMPESFDKNDDPLFAYDNGSIDLNNIPNNFTNTNQAPGNSFDINFNYNSNNDIYNNIELDKLGEPSPFTNFSSNNSIASDNINLNNKDEETYKKESEYNNSAVVYNSFENSNNDISYTIDNTQINKHIEFPNIEIDNHSLLEEKVDNSLLIEKNKDDFPEETNEESKEYEVVQNQSLEDDDKISYEIVQEKELSDNTEKNSLIDLGIDDIYAEEDTIDIMDFEEESEDKINESKEESPKDEYEEEPQPIKFNVEKIKEYILKLKEEGLDVEIEEFDFEKMYQLIVKINK